jgi:hypothetical protein
MVIEPKNANEEKKKNISIFIIYMDEKKLELVRNEFDLFLH